MLTLSYYSTIVMLKTIALQITAIEADKKMTAGPGFIFHDLI